MMHNYYLMFVIIITFRLNLANGKKKLLFTPGNHIAKLVIKNNLLITPITVGTDIDNDII